VSAPGRCRSGRWELFGSAIALLLLVAGTQALARGPLPWSPAAWAMPGTGDVVLVAAGLLFLGLGFLTPLHAGVVNLAIYPEFLAGFALAACTAHLGGIPPGARAALALVAGAAGGAALGSIVMWLRRRFAVHEVLSGLLLGLALMPAAHALAVAPTAAPALTFQLSLLTDPLHLGPALALPRQLVLAWGILLLSFGVVLALLLAHFLHASARGLELRVLGANPLAAIASGVNVDRTQLLAMLVGGACAGVCGALQLWTQTAVALERWPLPLAFAGVTMVCYALGSVRGLIAVVVIFTAWLTAPGTLAVLEVPGLGAAVALLLILPALWVLPRVTPDQGAPRAPWRTRHRDPF
jgi:simple sugar transport system permease protein